MSQFCRDLVIRQGLPALANFVAATTGKRDRFFGSLDYALNVITGQNATLTVEVDGNRSNVSDVRAKLIPSVENSQKSLKTSWQADDGAIRTGKLLEISNASQASFVFRVRRSDQD